MTGELLNQAEVSYRRLIKRAFAIFAIPYSLLSLFLLDLLLLGHLTQMVFLSLFLLTLLPCSVIGLRLTTQAEDQKQVNSLAREVAWGAGILLGVLGSLAGVPALGAFFIVGM